MEGPMGPRGLGPKTIKLSKSFKIMKIRVFCQHGKDAHRDCEGSTERQLQIIDMELFGANCVFENCKKVSKVSKLVQFWVQAVCLTTRLRRVIGWLQTK